VEIVLTTHVGNTRSDGAPNAYRLDLRASGAIDRLFRAVVTTKRLQRFDRLEWLQSPSADSMRRALWRRQNLTINLALPAVGPTRVSAEHVRALSE